MTDLYPHERQWCYGCRCCSHVSDNETMMTYRDERLRSIKDQHATDSFPQDSEGGSKNINSTGWVSPVSVSDSHSLQCSVTVWWNDYGMQKPVPIISKLSNWSNLKQNRSFWGGSSQPISWRSTEGTKPNATKANNTRTKQSKLNQKNTQNDKPKQAHNKNSSGDEIANVNFYAVRPERTRIRWNNAK